MISHRGGVANLPNLNLSLKLPCGWGWGKKNHARFARLKWERDEGGGVISQPEPEL